MRHRVCPKCGSTRVVRSSRKTLLQMMTPIRRYKCRACHHRFLGLRHVRDASHVFQGLAGQTMLRWKPICPRCDSTDVRRTNARNVQGSKWAALWRLLHFPAYRCNGCRGQFFAVRPPVSEDGEEQAGAKS